MFKKQNSNTPSLRHSIKLIRNVRKKPLLKKSINFFKQKLGKSNHSGKIISRHKECGAKKKYRILESKRSEESLGVVCSLEYDPYRTGFIMAVFDTYTKKFFYALAPEKVAVGDSIESGNDVAARAGSTTFIGKMPIGTVVSNVSTTHRNGGKLARSAGTYCIVRGHRSGFSLLELMSGELRLVPQSSRASVGRVSNESHFLEKSGKAGRSRWLGKRPKVRGVAMNPIDHPNGGGEGKKSGQRRSPWGRSSKLSRRTKNISQLVVKKRYE